MAAQEMYVQGTLAEVGPVEEITGTFRKRDVFIATDDQYPQFIKLQLTNERCSLIDEYAPGEQVRAHFNLGGKKFVDKHGNTNSFNNLTIWRIERLGGAAKSVPAGEDAATPATRGKGTQTSVDDDVPF